MNCLVVGSSGFIGTHLCGALAIAGHKVFGVDTRKGWWTSKHIDIINGPFAGYFLDDAIDWVFHLAAMSRTPPTIERPLDCFEVNVLGSVNVLETARKLKVKRVILASSNVVLAANTPYKASKLAMEHAAAAYRDCYGLSTLCLRLSNTTGPGLPKGDLACIAQLRDSLAENGYVTLTGDGEQSRDFSHVFDVCRAFILAAESHDTGDPLDICTGTMTTMQRVVNYMEDALGRTIERYHVPDRKGDWKHIIQDPWPAKCRINYCVIKTSEEAISDAVR